MDLCVYSFLRQIVCVARHHECTECALRQQCVFPLVFSPARDRNSGPKRQQTPPRGFVIKPPLNEKTRFEPGATIVFDFLLIGPLTNCLAYVIVPFIELGRQGIGIGRGKFSLAAIDAINADGSAVPVYREADGIVHNPSALIDGNDLTRFCPLPTDGRVTLGFMTPTHIRFNPTGEKGKSRPVRTPQFFHIACRLRDRISALCREYGPAPLKMDFKGFGLRAGDIRTVQSTVSWVEGSRVSRTRHRHDLSGFVGEITFEGDLGEFWPFLVLGQYVHVGDNAVFGRGWYMIES
ncbi:MAG: hypothetical protein BA865_06670 [Desulfobacterales bacterium S5133MH4]|nr:MAG: hypothetical protein BA865_06670 [Desulfobacterales bacterium S5133MH4]